MIDNGKWVINITHGEIWTNVEDWGEFDSKEKATEYGKKNYTEMIKSYGDSIQLENDKYFSVGQVEHVYPHIDAERIIDDAGENIYDQCGEVADDYLMNVNEKDIEELEEKLNDVFSDWLKKTNNQPTFYQIANTEDIGV